MSSAVKMEVMAMKLKRGKWKSAKLHGIAFRVEAR
jgi:hypothetical protein